MRAGAVSPGEVGRWGSTGGGRRAMQRRATPGVWPAARGSPTRVRGLRTRPADPVASAAEECRGPTCDRPPAAAGKPARETVRRRGVTSRVPIGPARGHALPRSLPPRPQRRLGAMARRRAREGQPAPTTPAHELLRARERKGPRTQPKESGCQGIPGDDDPGPARPLVAPATPRRGPAYAERSHQRAHQSARDRTRHGARHR